MTHLNEGESTVAETASGKTAWDVLSHKLASRSGRIILWILLFQVVLWVYSPSFSGPFVYDGVASIANNQEMRQPGKWWQLFKKHESSLQFDRRPVPGLLTLLNFQISGLTVFGYRLVNAVIHWLTAILLGETILLLGKRMWDNARDLHIFAMAVAVCWAVHPLNATPVVYIYQRMESLSALFLLLCIYAMLRSRSPGRSRRHSARWGALALLSGAFSMLSKETGVALLVILPLFDRLCHGTSWAGFFRERGRFYAIFTLLTGLILIYLLTGARVHDVTVAGPLSSPLEYAKAQCRILLKYLTLVFWPEPLVFVAVPRHVVAVGQWLPQAVLLGLIVTAVIAAARLHVYRWVWLPWLLAAAVLAPTSSILPIPAEPEADYRMYLPSACVISVALGGLIWAGRRLKAADGFLLAAVLALTLILAGFTRDRAAVFSSDLSVWQDVVYKQQDNYHGWGNLGYALARRGRAEEALACADHLLEAGNTLNNSFLLGSGHHLKGTVAMKSEDYEKARSAFQTAIETFPNAGNFRTDLAECLIQLKQYEEAKRVLAEELRINPTSLPARTLLSELTLGP